MFLTALSGIVFAVCLVSSAIAYVFYRSRTDPKCLANEKQQIKYSFRPSIDLITKKLNEEHSLRSSLSTCRSQHSSASLHHDAESLCSSKSKGNQSIESLPTAMVPTRSTSMGTTLYQVRRPRSANWRQGSIVDSSQMALIQFALPPSLREGKSNYRRRSVPICHDLIHQSKELSPETANPPVLVTFSLYYSKTSQLQVQFHSLTGVPERLQLSQLTFKVKLFPDGKEKAVQVRQLSTDENLLGNSLTEHQVTFSNVSGEKLMERSLLINVHGKDRAKKSIHIGQIGKVAFNQLNRFHPEQRLEFIHEVEKIKPSSIELLVALERKDEHYLHVDLQRLKGLKIDQKHLDATGYLRLVLLDRHRPLTSHQTKVFRLNASNLTIADQYQWNIFAYNATNFDRLMLMVSLYSNAADVNEHRCIARMKLGSALFTSGNGTVHWQQFKARESFSMWHTLNKYQAL